MVTGLQPAGLPHSDMRGSIPVCGSPRLFAAYHVLPRLRKPRHPPFALLSFLSCESIIHPHVSRHAATLNSAYSSMKLQSLIQRSEKNFPASLNYKLINFSLPLLSLSILSKIFVLCIFSDSSENISENCFRAVPGARTPYGKKDQKVQQQSPQGLLRASHNLSHSPKRRCSSHTFRYGYLVTT